VLTVPIQALTVRSKEELKASASEKDAVQAAGPSKDASKKAAEDKDEVQGVFIIRDRKAEFIPVETGITGTTDIEVLNGLKPGDEIITGSYKVLRTLRPGASVKIDNTAPKKEEDQS
jgi:HlyD family secretion protein